jgi:hypothetical protein
MKLARQADVGDEARLAAQKFAVLEAPDRRADALCRGRG